MTIDWTRAPSWARYAAMDDDGTWHWHENEPKPRHDMWWEAGTGRRDQIPADIDWKTTLVGRPA